jgi:hypothetical protein
MLAPPVETRTVQAPESGSDADTQIEQLKEELGVQQEQAQQRIEELERTNKLLREQIDAVLHRFFGNRTKDAIHRFPIGK